MQTKYFISISLIILLAQSMMACASAPEVAAQRPALPVVEKAPAAVEAKPVPETAVTSENKAHIEKLAAIVSGKAAEHHVVEGISPEKAQQWLKNGNARFTKGHFRRDGATRKDIERLATGQKPHSIVLSCSDSRVPPEVVFDQKLGEIFVVRTAGETLDPMAIASIEYAVEHLGSRNILVMGHSQCGAVKAAFGTMDGKDAGSPNLNKLVADIHPRIKEFAGKTASKGFVAEGWANTKGVAQDLLKRSNILAEKVKSGDVKINSALYNLDAGTVDFAP